MGDHLARFGEHFLCRVYTTNELTLFLLPQGVPFALAPFLVLLEAISYCFRALSLGIRLFANMMAGHSLVKILSGFAWTMLSMGGRATVTTPSAVLPHLISGKLLQQPAAKRIWLTRSTEDNRMPNKMVRHPNSGTSLFVVLCADTFGAKLCTSEQRNSQLGTYRGLHRSGLSSFMLLSELATLVRGMDAQERSLVRSEAVLQTI